jgi:hypothetical protein
VEPAAAIDWLGFAILGRNGTAFDCGLPSSNSGLFANRKLWHTPIGIGVTKVTQCHFVLPMGCGGVGQQGQYCRTLFLPLPAPLPTFGRRP